MTGTSGEEEWESAAVLLRRLPLRLRKAVAGDSSQPPALLNLLARDDHWEVRAAVAGNPGAATGTLERLGATIAPGVLAALAANRRAPASVLRLLAGHPHPNVRFALARNRALPTELLRGLAQDSDRGPYRLGPGDEIPPPRGGGGTDFRPFFEAVARERDSVEEAVCVYLTDGFGEFPEAPSGLPVLWVVTAGGEALEAFPFGETARLITT